MPDPAPPEKDLETNLQTDLDLETALEPRSTTGFWLAVHQFNSQQFYACHDTLEALWMEALEPDKTFYQGILQVAVALYHLGNQNLRGAIILLGEGSNRLRRYEPDYSEIDVTALVTQSLKLLAWLQQISLQSPDLEQIRAIALEVLQSPAAGTPAHTLLPVLTQVSGRLPD
ncbi:MAG TPA: DUF309 domain-containing protein [Coleofasciculaceae cyanobacterium]|jgi:hypothetical protein